MLWILLGWRFTVAEYIGGIVMIVLMTAILRLFVSRRQEEEARAQTRTAATGHQHLPAGADLRWREWLTTVQALSDVGHQYRGDWDVLWQEVRWGRDPGRGTQGGLRGCGSLSAGGELRPYGRDRIVKTNQSSVDELQREQRDNRLSDRIEVDHRVCLPRASTGLIGPSAPQVYNSAAVNHHTDCAAHFSPIGEVAGKRLTHRSETLVALSVNGHAHGEQSRSLNRRSNTASESARGGASTRTSGRCPSSASSTPSTVRSTGSP